MGLFKLSSMIIISLMLMSIIISLNTSLGVKQLLYPQIYEKAINKININNILGSEIGNLPINTSEVLNQVLEKSLSYVRGEKENSEMFIEISIPQKTKNNTVITNKQKINFLELLDKEGTLTNAKKYANYYNSGIYALWIIIAVLVALLLLFDLGKLGNGLRWVGITAMIAGIIVIISGGIAGNILYTGISTTMPMLQPGITEIITPIFHAIKINGIITLIAGFIITITSIFAPNGNKEEEKEDNDSEDENDEKEEDEDREEKNDEEEKDEKNKIKSNKK